MSSNLPVISLAEILERWPHLRASPQFPSSSGVRGSRSWSRRVLGVNARVWIPVWGNHKRRRYLGLHSKCQSMRELDPSARQCNSVGTLKRKSCRGYLDSTCSIAPMTGNITMKIEMYSWTTKITLSALGHAQTSCPFWEMLESTNRS